MSLSWPKCRCSHRSVAPHLRLVQSVHLASRGGRGPEWGAESRGDRKEGDLNTPAMPRGSCVLSNKETEFNEDFETLLKPLPCTAQVCSAQASVRCLLWDPVPMTELSRSALTGLAGGASGLGLQQWLCSG